MSKLRWPLRDELRDLTPTPGETAKLWSWLEERQRPRLLSVRRVGALVTLALLLGGSAIALRHPRQAGPLRASDGTAVAELSGTAAFDDGSRIELDRETTIEPLATDGTSVDLLLHDGRARFAIVPSGRRWTIEAGVASVQVIAGRFAMFRSSRGVRVEVYEGSVVLRGDAVPGHAHRLDANHSLEVSAPLVPEPARPRAPASGQASVDPSLRSSSPLVRHQEPVFPARATTVVDHDMGLRVARSGGAPAPVASEPSGPIQARPDWKALVSQKRYDEAYALLGADGLEVQAMRATTAEDVLALSDIARVTRHVPLALRVLERRGDEFTGDPSAGLISFTRARLLADEMRDPASAASAASAFAKAINEGLPDALDELATYRVVQLRERSGDHAGAAAAATRYRSTYPRGTFSTQVDAIVGPPR